MFSARVKAWLVNQRFQESDALRPDCRLVLVHLATPKLPTITLDGVYYETIDLIVSAIYQESFSFYAQMETFLVKAANCDDFLVTTMSQSSSFLKHHTEKMLIQRGGYLGMQLIILEVML